MLLNKVDINLNVVQAKGRRSYFKVFQLNLSGAHLSEALKVVLYCAKGQVKGLQFLRNC